jgi:homoserine/homoserine lactone efflux protein
MTWETWALFVITETVLCLTPGPAVLCVLSQGLARGAAKSLRAAFGILAANALYFIVSATGLGVVLAASYRLFFVIKWIGAAYLIYLGLKMFVSKAAALAISDPDSTKSSDKLIFLNGFIVQAANPKALLFFTAIVPQFINPHRPVPIQIAILGVSSILVEFLVLLGYGTLAGRATHFARQPRFLTITNRVAGSLLIGAGLGLASLRRN